MILAVLILFAVPFRIELIAPTNGQVVSGTITLTARVTPVPLSAPATFATK